MIHLFHGFLGSRADFDFLPPRDDLIVHDLYNSSLDTLPIAENDILIGYSMGGRIALELASRVGFNIKKLVLINAHPGLRSEEECRSRSLWEDMIEKKMLEADFVSYWNSLPIFSYDKPLERLPQARIEASRDLFHRYRLSKQKNFLPELVKNKEKVLWIIGSEDEKYRSLVDTHFHPNGIPFKIIEGGHRLFQCQEDLALAFKTENIL